MELKDKVSFGAGDSWTVSNRTKPERIREFDEVLEMLEESAVSIEEAVELNENEEAVVRNETLAMEDGSVWEYSEDDEELVPNFKRTIRRVR